jgi:hypothetical protein
MHGLNRNAVAVGSALPEEVDWALAADECACGVALGLVTGPRKPGELRDEQEDEGDDDGKPDEQLEERRGELARGLHAVHAPQHAVLVVALQVHERTCRVEVHCLAHGAGAEAAAHGGDEAAEARHAGDALSNLGVRDGRRGDGELNVHARVAVAQLEHGVRDDLRGPRTVSW